MCLLKHPFGWFLGAEAPKTSSKKYEKVRQTENDNPNQTQHLKYWQNPFLTIFMGGSHTLKVGLSKKLHALPRMLVHNCVLTHAHTQAHSEPCHQLLAIFAKQSILDVWQGFECALAYYPFLQQGLVEWIWCEWYYYASSCSSWINSLFLLCTRNQLNFYNKSIPLSIFSNLF